MKCDKKVQEIDVDTADLYSKIGAKYNKVLERHIENRQPDEAHKVWNKMADICCLVIQGKIWTKHTPLLKTPGKGARNQNS